MSTKLLPTFYESIFPRSLFLKLKSANGQKDMSWQYLLDNRLFLQNELKNCKFYVIFAAVRSFLKYCPQDRNYQKKKHFSFSDNFSLLP